MQSLPDGGKEPDDGHAAAAQPDSQTKAAAVQEVEITGTGYKGGEPGCIPWEQAVLNQEHTAGTQVHLEQGLNQITVYAREAGIVLERIVLHPADAACKETYKEAYLGAPESWRVNTVTGYRKKSKIRKGESR